MTTLEPDKGTTNRSDYNQHNSNMTSALCNHLNSAQKITMNDTQKTLHQRRTIHDYLEQPIPEGSLERALQAGLRAPNHKLTNPWRFTQLGPQARKKLVDLALELKCPDPENTKRIEKIRSKFERPAHMLVVSQLMSDDDLRAKEDYAAVACAIQNISLSLWSEGVGSKWSSGGVTRHEKAYALAQIPPTESIVGFLWIGIPENTPETPRLALEHVLRQTP